MGQRRKQGRFSGGAAGPRPGSTSSDVWTTDLVLLLLLGVTACAFGFVLRDHNDYFTAWHLGIWDAGDPAQRPELFHASLLLSCPLVLAALAAAATRIPGAGAVVSALGLVAFYARPDQQVQHTWFAALLVVGFLAGDIVVLASERRRTVYAAAATVFAVGGLVAWHYFGGQHTDTVLGALSGEDAAGPGFQLQVAEIFYGIPALYIVLGAFTGGVLGRAIHQH